MVRRLLICVILLLGTMAPTKDDLSKLKFTDLQRELESRKIDTSGKKSDLVDRLFLALQETPDEKLSIRDPPGADNQGSPQANQSSPRDVEVLLARLMKEKQSVDEERIRVRAQAEQDEMRLQARADQLKIELELAKLGHVDKQV